MLTVVEEDSALVPAGVRPAERGLKTETNLKLDPSFVLVETAIVDGEQFIACKPEQELNIYMTNSEQA